MPPDEARHRGPSMSRTAKRQQENVCLSTPCGERIGTILASSGRRIPRTAKGRVTRWRRGPNRCPELKELVNQEAQPRSGYRTGLTGHGAAEALALESGGQIGFAAGKQAGEEGHHTSPRVGLTRGGLRGGVGSLVDDAYISVVRRKQSRKYEAQQSKSDTKSGRLPLKWS